MRAFKALDSTSEIKKEAISSVGDDEELVDVEVLVLAKVRARAISLDTGSDRKSNKSTSRRPSQNSQVSAADIVRRRSVTFMMNDNYLSLPKDIENMNHHSDEEEEEEEQDVGARVFKSSLTKSSSSSGQQSRLKRTAVNEVKTASQLNEMTAGSGEDINNIPEDVELDKKKKESILPRRRTYSGDSKKSVKGGIIPNNGNQSTDTMLKSSVDNSIGQTFIFHPSLGRSVGVKRVSSNKESGNGQGETRKRSSSDKNIRVEQIVKQGGDATSDGSDSVNTNSLKKRPSLKKKSYLAPIDTRAGTGSSGIPSAGSARFPRSLSSINSAIQRMGGQPSGVPAVVNTSLEGYINTSNPMVFKNNNTGVGASGDYISAVLGSDHELETHISYKIGRAASTSLTNLPDVLPQELEYLCQDVPDPDEEDKQLKRKSKPQQQHLNSSLGLSAAKRVWGATKAKLGASHSVPVAAKNANISGDKLPNTSGGDLELGVINTSSGNALHVISSAGVIDWPLMIASEEDGAGTGVRAFAAPNIVLPNSPTSTEPEELNMSVNISNSNNNNNGGGSPTFPRKGHPANFSRQLSIGASSINNQAGIGRRDDDGKLGLGMMEFRSQIKGGNGGLSGSYNSVASFGLLEKVAPNFTRTMSLPMVAGFVSTTFRSLPRWVTSHIPARYIALSCLWILMTLLLFSLAWTSCSTYDGFMGTNWCTSFVDVGPFYSPGYNATGISNMTSASKH